MATISLGGVFTSIDWSTIIDSLMAAERIPLTRLETKKVDYESKQGAIDALSDSFTAFKSAVTTLGGNSTLRSVNVSSSDSDVADAAAGSGAYEGTHTVEVNQLAQAHRLVESTGTTYTLDQIGTGAVYSTARNENSMIGAGQDDATWFTTTANGATYTFQFGEETAVTVDFAASTSYSLNQVAALINAEAGYTMAQVVDEGGDTYKLDLTAKYAGEIGEMTQTLDAGDAVDELNDEADYTKTDGTDGAAGVFSYTYDGTTRNLNIEAGATLEDLRDRINNDSANPGVTASLIQYSGTYHLVLSGNDTGEDYEITINDAETTIPGFDTADFYEAQVAQNAEYRIDGTPPIGTYIESSSNTITDAVDGITLSLNGTGTTTISLTRDTSALKSQIETVVDRYNSLFNTITLLTGYDDATEQGGMLQGDAMISSLLSPIRSLLTGTVTGFDSDVESYVMGAQLGIEVDRYGEMTFDEDVFDEAIETDFDAVVNLVGGVLNGYVSDDYFQYDSALSLTEPGEYEVKVEFDGLGNITDAWFRDEGDGEDDWRAAVVDGNTITGSVNNDEAGLQLIVTWDGLSATQTSDVRLMNGFAVELEEVFEDVLDTVDGPLKLRQDSYDDAIEDLETKIELMETRLENKEAIYTAKYARLEAALAQLDSYRASFDALFSSLDNNSNNNDD
ncbi:MAG: flagellar filament capping protein FliD [Phycisphaerae bacterium]|nr:flagellar filament capping protein FliD [Phycisphaerae bacterium]